MAYKSPNGVEDKQNESLSSVDEQLGAEVDTFMDKLSHELRLLGDQITVKGACANYLHQFDDETSLKSYKQNKVPEATMLSEGVSNCGDRRICSEGTDFDRRQAQPKVGVLSRKPVQQSEFDLHHYQNNFSMRNGVQPVTQCPSTSSTTTTTVATQVSSPRSTPLVTTEGGERTAQGIPLHMNIPPSLQEPRVNNTDIPTAFAEQQPSFRSTSTALTDLSPITRGAESQQSLQDKLRLQMFNGLYPSNFSTSLGMSTYLQPMSSVGGMMSSEDNSQNVSVFPLLGHPPMTAQPVSRHSQIWQNNGISHSGSPGGGGAYGRQISHSSSNSSLKSFINNDCLVKKLSWKILRHVALTLQCRHSSASWKDLVEMYGWDYERTYLFENKSHQEGIFFSLLLEPEFQDYSLEQLRHDLFQLPRRDILTDLNRMISEHNATASGGASYNQLN